MEFNTLLNIVDNEPLFGTGLLLSGVVDPLDVRKQLSRWTAAGKIHQLRRGLYTLASPYQKEAPHPFLVANRLQPGSYVSLQSALAYYDMIPEGVPVTTSVTGGRTEQVTNSLGTFDFHHVQLPWLRGYHQIELFHGQKAFVASPAKALLDLIYLFPGGDSEPYLRELRLQFLDRLDLAELQRLADSSRKPKLQRVVEIVKKLAKEESEEYEPI